LEERQAKTAFALPRSASHLQGSTLQARKPQQPFDRTQATTPVASQSLHRQSLTSSCPGKLRSVGSGSRELGSVAGSCAAGGRRAAPHPASCAKDPGTGGLTWGRGNSGPHGPVRKEQFITEV